MSFALLLSGRPILTEPQVISPTQLAFTFPAAPTFSHIAVFLTPGTVLPPDTAASIYLQLPPASGFTFLGALANEKPSAVFKVREGAAVNAAGFGAADDDAMTDEPGKDGSVAQANGVLPPDATVTLGISIEPVAQVQAALAAKKAQQQQQQQNGGMELVKARGNGSTAATPPPVKLLAQKIIGNAFNFLASFGSDTVPLKAFQDWWAKFEKKIEMDPGFLEREVNNG